MSILFQVKVMDANGNLLRIITQEELTERHWKSKPTLDKHFESRKKGIQANMKDATKEINFKTALPTKY